ncbi:hypothetical protein AVEN_228119-1 [Araneus ventricosus]|uniref:Tesmin/TSO1-like CXC domain-containing protein n=1 Tax=Araneus ventricosus TaxID=182803 RepID=A0A4Y2GMU4_ARAVE|nr:hypothetical protein AVEN_228119-1 [Araneus ventricosus]
MKKLLQYTKEKLLANECNKKRFIELLKKALQKDNICVQQAVEDAHLTIVNTAISVAPQYDYVGVVAAAKTKFNLARLPPTTDAAQLQTWLGNEKDPLKWGWIHTPSGLFPKKAEKDPAPESLLQCISCTCEKGCTNACGCRKAGLHFSLLCKHCIGQSCENPMLVILDNEFEEGDAPTPIDMVDKQLECKDIEL